MPQTSDSYVVELKEAHIMWGEYHPSRHSHSRREIVGEGYIQIPARVAYQFQIYNDPYRHINALYDCVSYDNYYQGILLAQGNQSDSQFAKQFSEWGDLKAIGDWYDYLDAVEGDFVKVKFTAARSMIIEHSVTSTGFHI